MRSSNNLLRRLSEPPDFHVRDRLPKAMRSLSLGGLMIVAFALTLGWVLLLGWLAYTLTRLVLS